MSDAAADLADPIRQALRAQVGDMRDDARRLLNALGYRSGKTLPQTWAPQQMLDFFGSKHDGPNESELRKSARKIAVVFQTGDAEIQNALVADPLFAGTFQKGDARSFIFAVADLKPRDGGYSRGRLAKMTRAVNRCFNAPAVVLFRRSAPADGTRHVSLAFVHRRRGLDARTRHVLGRVSILREINRDDPHRGHLDILRQLVLRNRIEWMTANAKPRNFDGLLAAWLNALDTEELNKRFYAKLLAWFDRAVAQCRFPDGASPGKREEQVMRMITRLLFIWFVKEKGLAPPELFTEPFAARVLKNHDPENSDYYRAVLQNLFFGTLNTPMHERGFRDRDPDGRADPKQYRAFNLYRYADLLKNPADFVKSVRPVPFVNGGLFDCLDGFQTGGDRPDRKRVDCFTDNPTHRKLLRVPARLFFAEPVGDAPGGLFPLFNRFKFTVAENTPLEQDVALDPELLGLVFENLLAAIVPESRDNARHEIGAYYTPRVIVDYMVNEALAAHLSAHVRPEKKNLESRLRDLVGWEGADENAFSESEKDGIIKAVDNLRMLDPAVGSGAFPMGMLQKLVHVLAQVDPENAKWKKQQLDKAAQISDPTVRKNAEDDIQRVFLAKNNFGGYGRKLYLIQNVIHGADILPAAAQISRLRFFISLVIDQRRRDDEDNRGIEPLPNLETKLVAADSLIALTRKGQAKLSETEDVRALKDAIARVRLNYFGAKTRAEKIRLREEDEELHERLSAALEKHGFIIGDAAHFSGWSLYDQTGSAGWFDPEFMLGVDNGFDIVIGNPPYVRHELFVDKKPALRREFGAFFFGTADLYSYFYHRGLSLLRNGGHLCLITSNKWMRLEYGRNLRRFFAAETAPRLLFDLAAIDCFPTVIVDNNILLARKETALAKEPAILSCAAGNDLAANTPLADYFRQNAREREFIPDEPWIIRTTDEEDFFRKVKAAGVPLGRWKNIRINFGIKTGRNEAFVIDKKTRDRLIAEHNRSADIIAPIIRGRHSREYVAFPRGEWLINAHNGLRDGDVPPVDVPGNYPAIYRHLQRWEPALKKRQDQGAHWTNLRDCAYLRDFDGAKLAYPIINRRWAFPLVEKGIVILSPMRFIAGDLEALKYIGAILASRMMRFYYRISGNIQDDEGFQMDNYAVARIPIPRAAPEIRSEFCRLFDRIVAAKRANPDADTSEWESEVDRRVYALYALTPEEIRLVEGGENQ